MSRLLVVGSAGWRDRRRVAQVVAGLQPGWPGAVLLHGPDPVGAEAARAWGWAGGRTERVPDVFTPIRGGDGPDLSVVFLTGDDPRALAWLDEAVRHPWAPHLLDLAPGQTYPGLGP